MPYGQLNTRNKMEKIAYYLFILPFSYLPLPILYLFTDFFYLLLITIVPYRKSVIEGNLQRSFPTKSPQEIKALKRKFYRHFTDLLAEGIKNLSLSKKGYQKRFKVVNPELMNQLYAKKKSVLLVSGHYNNWEWLITSQNILFKHQAYGIGMPMTSKFWDKKINAKRERFGMKVIHSKNYKEELSKKPDETKAILLLSDQSPADSNKSYWMKFLNQQTAVLFGAEIMAHQLNYSVVFFSTRKVRRGYYEMELTTITEEPANLKWGEITEKHTHLLEKEIIAQPQFWLWSHKRWKRDVPSDLEKLKQQQRAFFNQKFNQ